MATRFRYVVYETINKLHALLSYGQINGEIDPDNIEVVNDNAFNQQ